MKHHFQIPDFPNADFEIETSVLTGKSTLLKDNVQVEQSKEKGKPFLIPNGGGDLVKAYTKPAFPDSIPTLEINGTKHRIVEKLKWYQYALAALPVLLLFVGGAIGGALGAAGMVISINMFRQEGSETSNYIKVIGVIALTFFIYFALAFMFI